MASSIIDDIRQRNKLDIDHARLFLVNNISERVFLWTQYEQCYKCPYLQTVAIDGGDMEVAKFKTYYTLKYVINTDGDDPDAGRVCAQGDVSLRDQSEHILSVYNVTACSWKVLEEGRSNVLTLVLGLLVAALLAATFYAGRFFYRRYRKGEHVDEMESEKVSQRLKSLDAFRGFTMLCMIFVNWGAGGFHFLDHAEWDGIRFADFIFPFFIFIMGVTMAISLRSTIIKKDEPFGKVMLNIVWRSIKLFLLGLVLGSQGNADLRYVRIPGVLQRFALSYLFVASVHAWTLFFNKHRLYSTMSYLSDVIPYWPDWILASAMLIIHFSLTFGWQFDPNCPRGYIGPGGLYDNVTHVHCVGGAANKLDRLIFTRKHLYGAFTGRELYDPQEKMDLAHDPEGLLGVTTSIVLTFFGLQVGKVLLTYSSTKQRLVRWYLWAAVLAIFTGILAGTGAIPINKNLWSFTFVTVTGASAMIVFSVFYLLIDHLRVWPKGQPFHYPGTNSILLYIGHGFTGEMLPFAYLSRSTSHAWLLTQNLTGVLLWVLISAHLYRKKIFFAL